MIVIIPSGNLGNETRPKRRFISSRRSNDEKQEIKIKNKNISKEGNV
jgi:hypothetical protein